MKMRARMAALTLLLVVGGWWVVSGGLSRWLNPRQQTMRQYSLYTGKQPALQLRFEYPSDWLLQEESGRMEAYWQVRCMGPRNTDGTYSSYLSVRSSPLAGFEGKHAGAAALLKQRKTRTTGSTVDHEGPRKIGGLSGRELTLSFTLPALHHKGLTVKPTQVKERMVAVERSPYVYELIYSADAADYDRNKDVFEHLLKTLQFK